MTVNIHETGPTVYHPYPGGLEYLTIYRCHCKGSIFPECGSSMGHEPETSRTVVRQSNNYGGFTAKALHGRALDIF